MTYSLLSRRTFPWTMIIGDFTALAGSIVEVTAQVRELFRPRRLSISTQPFAVFKVTLLQTWKAAYPGLEWEDLPLGSVDLWRREPGQRPTAFHSSGIRAVGSRDVGHQICVRIDNSLSESCFSGSIQVTGTRIE